MSDRVMTNHRQRALGLLAKALDSVDGAGAVVKFERCDAWPAGQYTLSSELINALRAAIGSGRALLVRGEPGSGKSSLARAAAELCKRSFSSAVVQPNTQYEDLLWNVDHIERMGEAQRMGVPGYKPPKDIADPLSIERFVVPGPLWKAINPISAWEVHGQRIGQERPDESTGTVLLIDEIDKADASVCNGLLEALGNLGFAVPPLERSVHCEELDLPLIILTSNELRPLPAAFIRRCAVVDIAKKEGDVLKQWLIGLGVERFGDSISHGALEQAADLIISDRNSAAVTQAGTAEYMDLLKALAEHKLDSDVDKEIQLLDQIGLFFRKNA